MLAYGYVADQSTCIWRAITGLPCPGCGTIHAMIAMARGDLRAAWGFNPSSFATVPILLWNGFRELKERMR